MKYIPFLNYIKNRIKIAKKRENKNNRKTRGGEKMKFVKGVMIGGLITTGLMMMYAESDKMNKKKLMKKGKQFARKMGMM